MFLLSNNHYLENGRIYHVYFYENIYDTQKLVKIKINDVIIKKDMIISFKDSDYLFKSKIVDFFVSSLSSTF
jgi:hypothetical protein